MRPQGSIPKNGPPRNLPEVPITENGACGKRQGAKVIWPWMDPKQKRRPCFAALHHTHPCWAWSHQGKCRIDKGRGPTAAVSWKPHRIWQSVVAPLCSALRAYRPGAYPVFSRPRSKTSCDTPSFVRPLDWGHGIRGHNRPIRKAAVQTRGVMQGA